MTKTDIEWLEYANEFHYGNHPEINTAVKHAIQALERTRWIPVSERLPDGDVASVMIYTESGGVAEGQYYPTIKAWKQFRWSVENANVTHWMPLPNPPEVE